MSAFRRFCTATKRTANKVANKAEELADSAVLTVKIKNLEMKIDEKYEELGRLVYRDLHTDDDLEEEKLALVAAIDGLFDAIAELKCETAPAADGEQEKADEPNEGEA